MRAAHRLALALALIGLALPAVAHAGGGDEPEPPRKPRRHRSPVVLLDASDAVHGVDRAEGGVFRIRKRYGFEYTHAFRVDEHPMRFSVQGPALPRKRFGLCFELRF